jgi:hypothetical protein
MLLMLFVVADVADAADAAAGMAMVSMMEMQEMMMMMMMEKKGLMPVVGGRPNSPPEKRVAPAVVAGVQMFDATGTARPAWHTDHTLQGLHTSEIIIHTRTHQWTTLIVFR